MRGDGLSFPEHLERRKTRAVILQLKNLQFAAARLPLGRLPCHPPLREGIGEIGQAVW